MQTKFILHGGFSVEVPDDDRSDLYKEILKETPENVKILLVPFARNPERITQGVERATSEFNKVKGNKNITIEVATLDNFINQVESADVVYFHGGVSLRLLDTLKKYPTLANSLVGKIVAGESAGANVLCAYFYSPHADGVFEGLGILPYKIIPHYKKDFEGKLDTVGPDLELFLLPEYEYKVLYK